MDFEHWWIQQKDSFHGSFCDKMIIKQHLKMGWEAHTSESMKPLVEEIKEDAQDIQHNADKLADKINKL